MNLIWNEGRAFCHYEEWEDYQAGFYKRCNCKNLYQIDESEAVLKSPSRFEDICRHVVRLWPITSTVHLTNKNLNHKAWIGHAANYLNHGSCEECTVKAWHKLNAKEQETANQVADLVVKEFLEQCEPENYQIQSDQLGLVFTMHQERELEKPLISVNEFMSPSRRVKTRQ